MNTNDIPDVAHPSYTWIVDPHNQSSDPLMLVMHYRHVIHILNATLDTEPETIPALTRTLEALYGYEVTEQGFTVVNGLELHYEDDPVLHPVLVLEHGKYTVAIYRNSYTLIKINDETLTTKLD
ncbi:hypothetical protein [Vibrio phage LV6]|nr:hypothetical protein [Vibrio phage LV6]